MRNIITDSKTRLSDKIDELFADIRDKNGDFRSHSFRHIVCNDLIEDYFEETGEVPPSSLLDRMATYLIKEDKFRRKGRSAPPALEFPFLSASQYKRRIEREVDWKYAEHFDAEGNDLFIRTRASRIATETAKGKVKLPYSDPILSQTYL